MLLGEITRRAIALLGVRAWRSHAVALLAAALPLGALATLVERGGLPAILLGVIGWCVAISALTLSTFAARWRSASPVVIGERAARAIPWAVLHASIVASPLLGVVVVLWAANAMHPLLALALVPLAFVAVAVAGVAVLLVVTGVVMGDRSGVPLLALEYLRPHVWKLAWGLTIAAVPVLFAALPVACVGLVVMAVPGPFGWLGIGLALAAPLPCYAALGVSMWRVLGGGALDSTRRPARRVAVSTFEPQPAVAGGYVWQPGPAWQLVLDPATPWGTWIELAPGPDGAAMPRTVGLTVDVTAGIPMPRLLTCDEAGNWLEWPVPHTSGTILPVQLPVGASYVQLISSAPVASHAQLRVSTQEWVEALPGAAA